MSTSDDPRWVLISLDGNMVWRAQQLGAHFPAWKAAVRPGFPLYGGLELRAYIELI